FFTHLWELSAIRVEVHRKQIHRNPSAVRPLRYQRVDQVLSIPTTAIAVFSVWDMACSLSWRPWPAYRWRGGARPDHPINGHASEVPKSTKLSKRNHDWVSSRSTGIAIAGWVNVSLHVAGSGGRT